MNSESIIISFIFILHLFLFSWAILAFMNISGSYLIYNAFFLISLLWGVHEDKHSKPLFVALMINVMSIILDVVFIGILWDLVYRSGFRFVLSVMATFGNLIFRFLTSYVIYCLWVKRRENDLTHENIGSVIRDFNKYVSFSRSPQPQPPPPPQRVPQP